MICGRYLFAVTRGLDPGALDALPGLAGARVEVLDHEGLQAVVATVDLDVFGDQVLAEHLADPTWRRELAGCHHEVLRAAARHARVVPVRLATVCVDDLGVRRHLDDLRQVLEDRLGGSVSGPRRIGV